ncbi:cytochrome b/b6 domain-containing protein [Geopseudomonas aromaticivorans]
MKDRWDINLRLLHWAIALTATFQQFSSLYMSDPGTQYLFPWHRILGAVAALVLLLFWLYSYAIYDLKMLFPWGREGRQQVLREGLGLLHGHLPQSGRGIGLSSFVHGLGLLAMSGCAATGMIMFAMIPPGHVGPPADGIAFTRYTLQHKFFGEMLWLYWCGHVAFALVHQIKGDNVLGAIFGLGRGRDRVD